jgi:hypothetical protein
VKQRLPLVISATALVVALFGSTPLGHAVVSAVPPFAKKAGYAKTAGNALAVNGIKAAKAPTPGFLVPLGADGKFPASIGQGGPAGPKGDTGPKGPKGDGGAPATKLFGAVTYDGTLVYGTGVTAATRTSKGNYTVTFNRDLTKCVAMAASGYGRPADSGGGNLVDLQAVYAVTDAIDATKVEVVTGNPAAGVVDNGFVIAAFC